MSRCLICDDHAIVRVALGGMFAQLRPQWEIHFANDFTSAIALINDLKPDLCLADLHMPGAAAEEGIFALKRALNESPLVVITGSQIAHHFKALFEIGVSGILEKTSELTVFETAIETVLAGGNHFDPNLLATLGKTTFAQIRLTSRQIDVLNLVAIGHSNKEIARLLSIAPATVKTHLEHAMRLLDASNRTEAIFRWKSIIGS